MGNQPPITTREKRLHVHVRLMSSGEVIVIQMCVMMMSTAPAALAVATIDE